MFRSRSTAQFLARVALAVSPTLGLLAVPGPASAAPCPSCGLGDTPPVVVPPRSGSLDKTFDGDGKRKLDITPVDLHVLPDGSTLYAATIGGDLGVVRLTPSGHPDPAFGQRPQRFGDRSGTARIETLYSEVATSLDVLPDGSVVVAGYNDKGGGPVVARFLSDGSPDHSFGRSGWDWWIDAPAGRAVEVAAQPDGRVILAIEFELVTTLFRLGPSGAVDETFGDGGVVWMPNYDDIVDMAVHSDGAIVAASGATVTRFTSDGQLDTGFGGTGTVGLPALIERLAVQSDGMIVVAFGSQVVRLLDSGLMDDTFAATLPPLRDVAEVLIEQSGGIVIVGETQRTYYAPEDQQERSRQPTGGFTPGAGDAPPAAEPDAVVRDPAAAQVIDLVVVKLTPDGALDPNFGFSGVAVYGDHVLAEIELAGVDSYGRVVAVRPTLQVAYRMVA